MTIKDYALLNYSQQIGNQDINEMVNDLNLFIDIHVKITESLHTAKVNFEYWKEYLEIHAFKFSLQSSTISSLFLGTILKDRHSKKPLIYPDLNSIYLLMRAQMESYLMFYYLNVQPLTNEEGEFKYLLYNLSGLNQRQSYFSTTKEHINQLQLEKIDIDSILKKIQSNIYFLSLSSKEKKFILKTKPAKIMTWAELIKRSHLNTTLFLPRWKLYSNYAHSEMISSIQIKHMIRNREELNQVINHTIEMAYLPICIFIKDLTKLFNTAEIVYNTFPSIITSKIDLISKLGTSERSK